MTQPQQFNRHNRPPVTYHRIAVAAIHSSVVKEANRLAAEHVVGAPRVQSANRDDKTATNFIRNRNGNARGRNGEAT